MKILLLSRGNKDFVGRCYLEKLHDSTTLKLWNFIKLSSLSRKAWISNIKVLCSLYWDTTFNFAFHELKKLTYLPRPVFLNCPSNTEQDSNSDSWKPTLADPTNHKAYVQPLDQGRILTLPYTIAKNQRGLPKPSLVVFFYLDPGGQAASHSCAFNGLSFQ